MNASALYRRSTLAGSRRPTRAPHALRRRTTTVVQTEPTTTAHPVYLRLHPLSSTKPLRVPRMSSASASAAAATTTTTTGKATASSTRYYFQTCASSPPAFGSSCRDARRDVPRILPSHGGPISSFDRSLSSLTTLSSSSSSNFGGQGSIRGARDPCTIPLHHASTDVSCLRQQSSYFSSSSSLVLGADAPSGRGMLVPSSPMTTTRASRRQQQQQQFSSTSSWSDEARSTTTTKKISAASSPFSSGGSISKDIRGGDGGAGAAAAAADRDVLLPVAAMHVAQTIDLYPCLSDLMARYTFRKQTSHKNSVLIELAPDSTTTNNAAAATTTTNGVPRYVALYRFGSLVFVNCPPPMVAEFASFVKKRHAVHPVPNGLERKENYGILLQPATGATRPQSTPTSNLASLSDLGLDPTQAGWPSIDAATEQRAVNPSTGSNHNPADSTTLPQLPPPLHPTTGEYCVLNELDMNGISVVSHVMAQTVALDTYNDMVDELLTKFARINYKVTQTGLVPISERAFLFKTIAQNHIIFNDMISKLRIKDRSDTAWNLTRYESTWYGMRDEFEMDERFENMEFKLKLIEQNAKFFVEALQSQKSSTLEWIIIVLIAVECVIMTADMTGMGEAVLSPMLEQVKGWWAPGNGGGAADVLVASSSSSVVVDAASDSAPPGTRSS